MLMHLCVNNDCLSVYVHRVLVAFLHRLPPDGLHDNDMFEHVRSVAGDLVESVSLHSEFKHPKTEVQLHV